MKVFIIAECGFSRGAGHVTRCASICQAFEDKEIFPEFIVNGDESAAGLLNGKTSKIYDWLKDKDRLFGSVSGSDVVVIDSYLADAGFYAGMPALTRLPVYIDDNMRIDYPSGIVVNGGIGAEELGYPAEKDTVYLLGPKYVPLRKEFVDVPNKGINEKIESLMITFGGDDATNMTPEVLKVVRENFPDLIKKVVIGKGFKNKEEIYSQGDLNTEFVVHPDAEGMRQVMLSSDAAISAGGQTLYELARVGVPSVAIAVAGNQMDNIKGWRKAGFIEYAGWSEDDMIFKDMLNSLLALQPEGVRKIMSKAGRSLVDGMGAERIVDEIMRRAG